VYIFSPFSFIFSAHLSSSQLKCEFLRFGNEKQGINFVVNLNNSIAYKDISKNIHKQEYSPGTSKVLYISWNCFFPTFVLQHEFIVEIN
jgi:hypothetical protein